MSATSFTNLSVTVKIRRPGQSAQNRENYVEDFGGKRKTVDRQKATSASRTLGFDRDTTATYFITKLDRQVANPWFKMKGATVADVNAQIGQRDFKIKTPLSNGDLAKLLETPKISRRTELVHRFGVTEEDLSDRVVHRGVIANDLSSDPGERKGSLIERHRFRTMSETVVRTDKTIEHALDCELFLASKRIAATERDFLPGMHSAFIVDLEQAKREQEQVQQTQMETIAKTSAFLESASEFDTYALAFLSGLVNGATSHKNVKQTIQSFVLKGAATDETEAFVSNLQLFAKTPGARAAMLSRYIVEAALAVRVFVLSKGGYYWPSEQTEPARYNLGSLKDQTVARVAEWLSDESDDPEALGILAAQLRSSGVKLPDEVA